MVIRVLMTLLLLFVANCFIEGLLIDAVARVFATTALAIIGGTYLMLYGMTQ